MGVDDALFRDLCENAYDLIQSVSEDGRILYVNRAWLETLGYEQQEVRGLRITDVIHPDSLEHCLTTMQEVVEGEPATGIEAVFRTREGGRVWLEGSARSLTIEDGTTVTCGIFRNITRSRQFKGEVDRLFDLSQDLLCIAGADGFFKRINPAFEPLLGYDRDELLSRRFIEFVHPADRPSTLEQMRHLAAGRVVVDFHNRYQAKDGSWKWLAWRATPAPDSDLIYAVARDITGQKRAERLLARQADELARSNADLERFAYVASHDLRAPLRAIRNLTDFIEQDMPEGLPAKVGEHLDTLRARVARMERLTEDLLEYSRAGRGDTSIRRVDTAAMVRDQVALMNPPGGFEVRVEGEMPVLETTAVPLEQVLRNLLGNAIKHHDGPPGTVVVSARESGDFWEFSVRDDGPGISVEDRDRAFRMFGRLHRREQVEGTGLGLAMVRRIVMGLGGKVWVGDGELGGADFRFTWPKRIERDDADDPDR